MRTLALVTLLACMVVPEAHANPVPAQGFEDTVILVTAAARTGTVADVIAAFEVYAAHVGATGAAKVNLCAEVVSEALARPNLNLTAAAMTRLQQAVIMLEGGVLPVPLLFIKPPSPRGDFKLDDA